MVIFDLSPLLLIIVPLVVWLFGSHKVRIITGWSLIIVGFAFWFGISGSKSEFFGKCVGIAGVSAMMLEFAAIDRQQRLEGDSTSSVVQLSDTPE